MHHEKSIVQFENEVYYKEVGSVAYNICKFVIQNQQVLHTS